jgi:hypothetical protein
VLRRHRPGEVAVTLADHCGVGVGQRRRAAAILAMSRITRPAGTRLWAAIAGAATLLTCLHRQNVEGAPAARRDPRLQRTWSSLTLRKRPLNGAYVGQRA